MLRAARASIADLVRGDPTLHYGSHLVRYARPGAGAGCRRAWQLGAAVLEPVYGAAVGADRRAGSAVRLPSPVISVGNAVWGGTGKTPMVEYVARLLQQPASAPGGGGGRAVVLTRGVGGDEDEQLRARLPSAVVAVGADRAAAARRALADMGGAGAVAAFILDDGLQHWALARDLELLMLNAASVTEASPFGNGRLIPRGTLREPAAQALARADVVVVHHAELMDPRMHDTAAAGRGGAALSGALAALHARLEGLARQGRASAKASQPDAAQPELLVVSSSMIPTSLQRIDLPWNGAAGLAPVRVCADELPTAFLRGKRVVAFCAIGDPLPLENSLRVLTESDATGGGGSLIVLPFVDHQELDAQDATRIVGAVSSMQSQQPDPPPVVVVTTEKDASRCASRGNKFWDSLARAAQSAGAPIEAVYVLRAELRLTHAMDLALERREGEGQEQLEALVHRTCAMTQMTDAL